MDTKALVSIAICIGTFAWDRSFDFRNNVQSELWFPNQCTSYILFQKQYTRALVSMIVYILSFVPYQFKTFGLVNGVCRSICLIAVYIEALV